MFPGFIGLYTTGGVDGAFRDLFAEIKGRAKRF